MGTLTSSNYSSTHTSGFINTRYTSYAVGTLEHLKFFGPINYIRVSIFSSDSLKAFDGETIPIRYSTIIRS